MELQEFIQTTLSEIVVGVKGFQDAMKESGLPFQTLDVMHGANENIAARQVVKFDIALAEGTRDAGKKGIGVYFAGVGLGGQKIADSSASSHTRVSFSVPIQLPLGG